MKCEYLATKAKCCEVVLLNSAKMLVIYNVLGCYDGYFTPRIILLWVPEQMTEGQRKVEIFIIKINLK